MPSFGKVLGSLYNGNYRYMLMNHGTEIMAHLCLTNIYYIYL